MMPTATGGPRAAATRTTGGVLRRGAYGTAAAVVTAVAVLALGDALDVVPTGFEPLTPAPVVASAALAGAAATVAYGVLGRVGGVTDRQFRRAAAALVLLSLALAGLVAAGLPGATPGALAVLAVLHAAVAVPIVVALTTDFQRGAGPATG